MNKDRFLTKSRMKIGLECPMKLSFYDDKNQYNSLQGDTEFLDFLAEGGYQVGELAKFYYKFHFSNSHYIDITSLGYKESIKETYEALKYENVIIAEPAISFDNFFIRVDILIKQGSDIKLIEVKSKSYNSNNENGFLNLKKSPVSIKSEWRPYLADIAFQTYVTSQSYPEWNIEPYLLLINKNKATNIDGLNQLFEIRSEKTDNNKRILSVKADEDKLNTLKEEIKDSVLTEVSVNRTVSSILYGNEFYGEKFDDRLNRPLRFFYTNNNSNFIEAAKQLSIAYKENKPLDKTSKNIGAHCSQCPFCWSKLIPEYKESGDYIQNIWNFPKNKLSDLFKIGIFTIEQLSKNLEFSPLKKDGKRYKRQLTQINFSSNNMKNDFIENGLKDEMNSWDFPFHFIDFETCTVPLPFHKNEYPYSTIAFQFSIHTMDAKGHIEHREWIAKEKSVDPSFEFVQKIKSILEKDNGSIFMYASHENTVLQSIKNRMTQKGDKYLDELSFINEISFAKNEQKPQRAMIDMKKIIEHYYYNYFMKGSISLKAVLPAIMKTSEFLKEKYSKELDFGTNLKGKTFYQERDNIILDPYKLLPKIDSDIDSANTIFGEELLADGTAAMKAFQILQFSRDVLEKKEEENLIKALLNYCELDTLAMLMLYEHLNFLVHK
tara:strand:- start:32 stop:2017 length:1986 start_codon:yes stop_codon:yes gene_type:complete